MARKLKELISLIKNQNKMLRICDDNIQQLNKSGAEMYLKYKGVEHTLETLRAQKAQDTLADESYRQEKHSLEVDKMTLKKELADMGVELWNTKGALSLSRQLAKSFQELVDRKHWETASIEDMAMNLHDFMRKDQKDTLRKLAKMEIITIHTPYRLHNWNNSTEDTRDFYRANLTDIISNKR